MNAGVTVSAPAPIIVRAISCSVPCSCAIAFTAVELVSIWKKRWIGLEPLKVGGGRQVKPPPAPFSSSVSIRHVAFHTLRAVWKPGHDEPSLPSDLGPWFVM